MPKAHDVIPFLCYGHIHLRPDAYRQKQVFGELKRTEQKDNYSWVQLVARQPNGEDIHGEFIQLSNESAFYEWRAKGLRQGLHGEFSND